MAGRGRGATLPAWMTAGVGVGGTPSETPSETPKPSNNKPASSTPDFSNAAPSSSAPPSLAPPPSLSVPGVAPSPAMNSNQMGRGPPFPSIPPMNNLSRPPNFPPSGGPTPGAPSQPIGGIGRPSNPTGGPAGVGPRGPPMGAFPISGSVPPRGGVPAMGAQPPRGPPPRPLGQPPMGGPMGGPMGQMGGPMGQMGGPMGQMGQMGGPRGPMGMPPMGGMMGAPRGFPGAPIGGLPGGNPNQPGMPPMGMGGPPGALPMGGGMPMGQPPPQWQQQPPMIGQQPPRGAVNPFQQPMGPGGQQPVNPMPAPGMPGVPPRGAPMGVPPKEETSIDPNNDVKCWSEHDSAKDPGRKYWYNKVTKQSTYEKPMCLKTPEERSIPPCQWMEYRNEGKVYYSNGKESLWTMPEEYRVWKERVDAVEAKKKRRQEEAAALAAAQAAQAAAAAAAGLPYNPQDSQAWPFPDPSSNGAALSRTGQNGGVAQEVQFSESISTSVVDTHAVPESTNIKQPLSKAQRKAEAAAALANAQVVYKTHSEAVEAFTQMLWDMKVSVLAKLKEAQDLCEHDQRWHALPLVGEKKQALAEYQTKKLKKDKELLKAKQRKHRDAFLLMLAENTDIDVKTRWREAQLLLQEDQRYKNIEDVREKEELFDDFVQELAKKEKADLRQIEGAALEAFSAQINALVSAGTITRKSTWLDSKTVLAEIMCKIEFKVLGDTDMRHAFQDLVADLEKAYKVKERAKKEALEKSIKEKLSALQPLFESLIDEGQLTALSKWREVSSLPQFLSSSSFQELNKVFTDNYEKDGGREKDRKTEARKGRSRSRSRESRESKSKDGEDGKDAKDTKDDTKEAPSDAALEVCRDIFDKMLHRIQDRHRKDRRLIKDITSALGLRGGIAHDTTYDQLLAGVQALLAEASEGADEGEREGEGVGADELQAKKGRDEGGEGSGDTERSRSPSRERSVDREKGDKEKDTSKSAERLASLSEMMKNRPHALQVVFDDLSSKAKDDYEEEQRQTRKAEGRFLSLLEDNFYLSDHVGLSWDEAKKKLQKRSAYDSVGKSDRKRLFAEYMTDLASRLAAKTHKLESMRQAFLSKDEDKTSTKDKSRDDEPAGQGAVNRLLTKAVEDAAGGKDRDSDRKKDRDRVSDRKKDKDRDSDRNRDKDRDSDRNRDKDRDSDRNKDRDRERERSSRRDRDKDRDRDRSSHRDKGEKRERDKKEKDRDDAPKKNKKEKRDRD